MTKKSFETLQLEDRRLTILQLLKADNDGAHNIRILQRALSAAGHGVSQDRLLQDLAWLKEQTLIQLDDTPSMVVARIAKRGADIVDRNTSVPGVASPDWDE